MVRIHFMGSKQVTFAIIIGIVGYAFVRFVLKRKRESARNKTLGEADVTFHRPRNRKIGLIMTFSESFMNSLKKRYIEAN